MQWYWIVALALACVLVYWVVISLIMYRASTHPKRPSAEQIAKRQEVYGFDSARYDALPKEKFSLTSRGVEIKGEIARGKGSEKVAVISHGYLANRSASARYAQMYLDMGFSAMTYDQRYFGESGGKFCSMGLFESDDLAEVVKLARRKFPDAKIVLHGESMGAAAVLLALGKVKDICYAVADCAFSDVGELYRRIAMGLTHLPMSFPVADLMFLWTKLICGFSPQTIKPIGAVKKTGVPILFIHGAEDKFVPAYMSKKMIAAAKNADSELYLVSGAKHALSYAADPKKYIEAVKNFDRKITTRNKNIGGIK